MASSDRRTTMRKGMLVLMLALTSATAAEAQTGKHLYIGGGIGIHGYSDSRFSGNEVSITPMYRFRRGTGEEGWGWDLKSSLSISRVNVPTNVADTKVEFGKLMTIPLTIGVQRAY